MQTEHTPMDAARPTHTVDTSGRTWRMVSNTAIPAVTEPPGELTYMVISWQRQGHYIFSRRCDEVSYLFGIRRVKPKELCDNQIAAVVVNSTTKPDYPLFCHLQRWCQINSWLTHLTIEQTCLIHELARDALETLHDHRIRALALLRSELMPGRGNLWVQSGSPCECKRMMPKLFQDSWWSMKHGLPGNTDW